MAIKNAKYLDHLGPSRLEYLSNDRMEKLQAPAECEYVLKHVKYPTNIIR